MASRLRVLGSGNAFCPPGRFHSCMLLDDSILIDAPPTILHQLQSNNISSAQITDLLITHWHGDHVFGLPFLLLDRRYISDREGNSKLRIHLHPNGIQRMKTICELAFQNLEDNEVENLSDVKKNLSEELDKLSKLLKDGVLTQEEFEKAKKKILDN